MAKKTSFSKPNQQFILSDLTAWNFIIFLTLAFMLIVAVVISLKNLRSTDYRTRAAAKCPAVTTTCPEGKAVCFTGGDNCPVCVCSTQ